MTCSATRSVWRRGRGGTPNAAIIDSQSVKTSCNLSESSQGIDASKKIKGRIRHIATDVLGLLLAVIVTAASMQDSLGGEQLLDQLADTHSSVPTAWVDGGYDNTVIRHGAQQGIQVKVAKRPHQQRIPRVTSPLGRRADLGLTDAEPPSRP